MDGCKWRASKADMPEKPSACQYILDYFERELHSELDMIRDECPGTASALAAACDEHLPSVVYSYERLSAEEKQELSKDFIESYKNDIETLTKSLKTENENYNMYKKAFKEYKPPNKKPKLRRDELQLQMQPIKIELDMENSAVRIDELTKQLRKTKKLLKIEQTI
jgi:predicted RNase H-like nuclease (RuvC/YqgF family)